MLVRKEPPLDTERAWAAGFLDGEGHFGFHPSQGRYKSRPYGVIQIGAAQKDRRVLDRLRKVLGVGKVYGPYIHSKAHPVKYFEFFVHNAKDTEQAIHSVWPWLSPVKRAQIRTMRSAYAIYKRRPVLTRGPKRMVHV